MNLKKLRLKKGLSQQDMASKFNLSFRGYQNIEYGYSQTSYENLIKFADFFHCSVDYLLGHQTQNVLYLDSLTDEQKEAVELIKQLDDRQVLKVIGYIERIKDTPFEEVVSKLLKKEE